MPRAETSPTRYDLVPQRADAATQMSLDRSLPNGRARTDVRVIAAWGLWLTTIACLVSPFMITAASPDLSARADQPTTVLDVVALAVPLATFGLILTLRRPSHPIGWLYAVSGLFFVVSAPLEPWIAQRVDDGRPLSAGLVIFIMTTGLLWAPSIACSITLPFLYLPDGRLRSRRWRAVLVATVTAMIVMLIVVNVLPGQDPDTGMVNPHAFAGAAGTVATGVFWSAWAVFMLGVPAAVLALIQRFRMSRGSERQQLRWVAAGGVVTCGGFLASVVLVSASGPAWLQQSSFYAGMLSLPAAVTVAVLRYRLWDLDRLISRTVTYAVVTGLLVVPYLLIVLVGSRLVAGGGDLAVAGATLAVAAAFQPLRRRVQNRVDRRFNRRRYDASRTVQAFAAHLRGQLDLDALTVELLTVVEQTMQPTRASLWRQRRGARAYAALPEASP